MNGTWTSLARFIDLCSTVDPDTALEAALKKQERELREMEKRKRELQELSQQQRFRPSDKASAFKIIKSITELVAVGIPLIDSMQEEWIGSRA